MKNFVCIAILATSINAHAQNIGIGITNPSEKLQVDSGNIKIGSRIWAPGDSYLLKFGDYDFVHVGEVGDDSLELQARNFTIRSFSGNSNIDLHGSLNIMSGALTIKDGTEATGKVLSSNANGNASWAYPPNYNSGFKVGKNSSQPIYIGGLYLVNFNQETYDEANAFTGDQFVAPVQGLYHFDAKLFFNLVASASRYNIILAIMVNGTELNRTQHVVEAGVVSSYSVELNLDHKLNAGDAVAIYAYQNSMYNQSVIPQFSFFSGHRIY